jgi:hypothetical protein
VFLATYAIARNRVGLTLAGFAILIAGFYIGYELNISSTLTARVAMWQSSWDNAVRGGDQIAQAIWGVSSGGLFGTGLGLGDTRYLPAGHTDLVLAAIGEELGFVGLLGVGAIFVMIAARGFSAALHAADDYGFFLATVVTLFLTLPVIIMAAGILGLVPLTGVVTPFLSFGGSAMVANFIALGIIVAIRNGSVVGRVLLDAPPVAATAPFRPAVIVSARCSASPRSRSSWCCSTIRCFAPTPTRFDLTSACRATVSAASNTIRASSMCSHGFRAGASTIAAAFRWRLPIKPWPRRRTISIEKPGSAALAATCRSTSAAIRSGGGVSHPRRRARSAQLVRQQHRVCRARLAGPLAWLRRSRDRREG